MSNIFPFFYQKINKLPKISDGTRFYSADTASLNSTLFIARSQYYDTLIHHLPEGFISIYHTQFGERIYSASVLDSQRWYLVTILRFGDGIEMRPSYRSIFIAVPSLKPVISFKSNATNLINQQNKTDAELVVVNSVIYPVSSRTYFPQYVAWTCFNSSLFMFTIFDNKIHTLEVSYDKSTVTYKITPRKISREYSFRSVISSNIPHVYMIQSGAQNNQTSSNKPQFPLPGSTSFHKINNNCSSPFLIDKTRADIPIKFKLPDEIKIYPNTEFHIFISPQRRNINPPLNENRCAIFANLDEISIVFPSSGFFIKIPNKYDIEEYKRLSKKYNPNIKINEIERKNNSKISDCIDYVGYTQEDAYFRPASRIPLYFFENGLLLIAAPRGFITAILIDQDDRIRASFLVLVFDPEKNIHNTQNKTSDNSNLNKNNDNDNSNNNIENGSKNNSVIDENEKLYNVFSLNDRASRVLSETTGHIYKMKLNPAFFASKDPRFIIPLLHYFMRPKKGVNFLSNNIIVQNKIDVNIIQLISMNSLQTFWNAEIFNEILLLLFNTSSLGTIFRERVCSTFAKSHFYKQWTYLFMECAKTKDDSNNIGGKAHISKANTAKTPDRDSLAKSRSNSMIVDSDDSAKEPISPILFGIRHNSNTSLSGSFGSDKSNDTISINDDFDDAVDDINNNNSSQYSAKTPRRSRRNSTIYPNSLPRNKLQNTINLTTPSQPLQAYCYDDSIDMSTKIRLSTNISTPLFPNSSDDNNKNSMYDSLPIYNFRDIETKALKITLETLQINEIRPFYKFILKIMDENIFFDLFKYSEKIRFAIYMQFTSIKFSLAKKPLYKLVTISDIRLFKENSSSSKTSKEFWSSYSLLPHDISWPEVGFRLNTKTSPTNANLLAKKVNQDIDILKRQWWFLRSKKRLMVQKEVTVPEENLFNFVEQVTNKSKYGFETFQLHQNMFGLSLYQTTAMPSK